MDWIKINQYEEYEINSLGEVRRDGKILKIRMASNGYKQVCLCKNGKPKVFRVHRLLSKAFIPNPDNKPQVNHIDGNRLNNNLDNLEWVTSSENNLHACRVTKNHLPPRSMAGKFGKDHNLSKYFWIEYPNGNFVKYESGLEFMRMTGLDHSAISWARNRFRKSYKFIRGKIKGLMVHFELV